MKTLYLILSITLTLLVATFIPSSPTTSLLSLPLPPNAIELRHQADLVYQQRLHVFSQIPGPGEHKPEPYNHRIISHD